MLGHIMTATSSDQRDPRGDQRRARHRHLQRSPADPAARSRADGLGRHSSIRIGVPVAGRSATTPRATQCNGHRQIADTLQPPKACSTPQDWSVRRTQPTASINDD